MPFLTLTSGLTIKVPTRGTTNWDTTMLTDTFQKISAHDHSGGGNGAPIGTGSLADNAITDLKMRLRNNQYLRSRNNAGNGDVNILKIGTDDKLQIMGYQHSAEEFELQNNQAVAADVTGLLLDPAKVKTATLEYGIFRDATTDLTEDGEVSFTYNGTSWEMSREFSGNAGITLTITNAGQVQYTSSNLSGHVESTLYFLIRTLGV